MRANWQIRAILFFSTLGADRLRSQMHTEPLPSPIGEESSQETPAQAQEVLSASTLTCVDGQVVVSAGLAEWAADAHPLSKVFQTPTYAIQQEKP